MTSDDVETIREFDELANRSAVVYSAVAAIRKGGDEGLILRQLVVALWSAWNDAASKLLDLDAIKPRRVDLGEGRIVRWDAPDEAVPVVKLERVVS